MLGASKTKQAGLTLSRAGTTCFQSAPKVYGAPITMAGISMTCRSVREALPKPTSSPPETSHKI